MTIRIYFAAAVVAFFIFAYWAGLQNGRAKCRVEITAATQNANSEIIKKSEAINENVLKTDTDNIRRILREKYTIAE